MAGRADEMQVEIQGRRFLRLLERCPGQVEVGSEEVEVMTSMRRTVRKP